jgi:Universal stress protein family
VWSLEPRASYAAPVDASAGADLLVLGSASGRLAGRSAGPVIRTCLSRAHCPLVAVRAETVHESGAAPHERPDTTLPWPDDTVGPAAHAAAGPLEDDPVLAAP